MPMRHLVPVIALCVGSVALAHDEGAADAAANEAVAPISTGSGSTTPAVRPSSASSGLWCFGASRRSGEAELERAFLDAVSADHLRDFHTLVASHPHRSGTPGSQQVIDALAHAFTEMGLEVETPEFDIYLAKPVSASISLSVQNGHTSGRGDATGNDYPMVELHELPVREPALSEDPYSADPDLDIGFNAWSGNGEATAEVVYANYGRKEDFERLKDLGVDVTGKIVIARYGGNYRGYKAKFAEAAGAAGLIIYYDPKDVGYAKGLMYPEGGWANAHSIQRGSLLTVEYEGDPLSPGFASVPGAPLLDPKDVELPTIPVQPIGWGAAAPILQSMAGDAVPDDWQGGLPFNYRLTSGPDVKVRLAVKQKREVTRTADVIAKIPGAKSPDEFVMVGCHHDAWNCGASDPLAGMILILEMARTMSDLAKAGHPPDRSIVFGAWDAEEYGLMGSTEWVEQNLARIRGKCVAYINLDMAAMGTSFHASSSPSVSRAIIDATKDVPQARDESVMVFDRWSGRSANLWPAIGTMGGGSDHVGFLCLAGVPCMGIGAGGSPGTSYHSNYDTLAWYRKVVGDDYAPAVMLTRAVGLIVSRIANADVSPMHAPDIAEETIGHLRDMSGRLRRAEMPALTDALIEKCEALRESSAIAMDLVRRALERDALDASDCRTINEAFAAMDRAWIGPGLPDRPWYKSRFMAPDRDSGYDSWPLPELRGAIEDGDADRAVQASIGIGEALDTIIVATATIRETASAALKD